MDRKSFVKVTTLGLVGCVVGSCAWDQEPVSPGLPFTDPVTFDLSQPPFDLLLQPGSWLLHPTEKVILLNVNGEIRAFNSRCTHSGCTRNWEFQNEILTCTCHGAAFDLDGKVVNPPADDPLQRQEVSREGNLITVT